LKSTAPFYGSMTALCPHQIGWSSV